MSFYRMSGSRDYSTDTTSSLTCMCSAEEGLGLDPELAEEELQMEIASDREDRNMSSEASLSDTSDPDQANDVEELLDPGYPVYFNCGIPKPSHPLNVSSVLFCS